MRENGFYWVKLNGAWSVAEIENNMVYLPGYPRAGKLTALDAIGDKIDIPEKYR